MTRYAAKRDAGEVEIVDALRTAGALVWRELPCDLLVYFRSQWFTVEVKARTWKRPRKDQAAQNKFLAETGTPVAQSPEDALRAVGAIR